MKTKFKNIYFVSIGAGLFFLFLDFVLFFSFKVPTGPSARWFYPMFILSIIISMSHFWLDFFNEIKRQKRIEEKFVDFVREMEGAVKSGISIPSSIIQASQKDYAELDPHLKKLANQVKMGISIHKALLNFANDTGNKVIKRSIAIVIEAEMSGGDIEHVLESVTLSLTSINKVQEEKKSAMLSQIIQGYIVYFVFIAIMLVLQVKLFPQLTKIGSGGSNLFGGVSGAAAGGASAVNLDQIFFVLVLIQGFFAGLMIGKFTENSLKKGILHSILLVTTAALIVTTIKGGI